MLVSTPEPPNYSTFFATPAIWVPGMSEGDWREEVDRMIRRSLATRDFVQNKISPEDFAEALYEGGFEPDQLFELWEEGGTLL